MKSETNQLIRVLNRSAVFDLIRDEGPVSRSEVSRRLKMSLPTVMRIIEELTEKNLIQLNGEMKSSGGRPSPLLEFNPKSHAVIGIDLGGTKMFGTVADLAGNVQEELYVPWEEGNSENTLHSLFTLIDKLKDAPREEGQDICGIGVGVPGVTYADQGVVQWTPSLGWRDFPLKELLVERYNLPVMVENDVNLAAMGEYAFGAGKGAASLVCIAIGTGIGAGIVIDRKIYHGIHSSAGEIGYLPPGTQYLGRNYATFGAVETLASGTGIGKRGREAYAASSPSSNKPPQEITSKTVFQAARHSEPWAAGVVSETIDYLAMIIASVSCVLDPEIIVLGGGVAREGDLLIEPIRQRLRGVIPVIPEIVQSELGYRAAVMGAIAQILDLTTDYQAMTRSF